MTATLSRVNALTKAPLEVGTLISVIIPSLNQGHFIGETLQSILNQDYPDWEIWVMDGGSTDSTLDILEAYHYRYPDRIFWVSEPDDGQSDAVNKGVARCSGDIIAWLNSDDTLTPNALKAVNSHFQHHIQHQLVYGYAQFVDKTHNILQPYPIQYYHEPDALKEQLAEGCFLCQPATFFRKDWFVTLGGLDPKLHLPMDYEFWIRSAHCGGQFGFIPETLAYARMYPENKTFRCRRELLLDVVQVLKSYYGYVSIGAAVGLSDYYLYGKDSFFHPEKRRPALMIALAAWLLLFYNLSHSEGQAYLWREAQKRLTCCLRRTAKL